MDAIWFHHPPQIQHCHRKSSDMGPNDHLTGTDTVVGQHQLTLCNNSEKISKVVQGITPAWSSTPARSTVEKVQKNNSGPEPGQMS